MKNKEELLLNTLKDIIVVYEEVASMRMRRVKNTVLVNREYLMGLSKIYYQVKYNYRKEINKLSKKNKKNSVTLRRTNGKTISVILTSNTGLYGDIIVRNIDAFLKDVVTYDSDVAVVGNIGRSMIENRLVNKKIYKFTLSDNAYDRENVKKLLEFLLQYEKIVVYHGKFKDILVQEPTKVSITGDLLGNFETDIVTDVRFIFEPSIEEVLSYFENEMLGSLFEHTVHESNLSKYSSRMISLDLAVNRLEKEINRTKINALKYRHKQNNKKLVAKLVTLKGAY